MEELKEIEAVKEPSCLDDETLCYEVTEYSNGYNANIINKKYIVAFKVKNSVESAYELYTLKYGKENQPIVNIGLGYVEEVDFENKEVKGFESYERYKYGKYRDNKVVIAGAERVQPLEKY